MEISSSSSSSELEGLEKEDDEDEEEIFDSSSEGKENHHQLGEFLVKVVKKYPKLEQFFFVLKNRENSPSLSS